MDNFYSIFRMLYVKGTVCVGEFMALTLFEYIPRLTLLAAYGAVKARAVMYKAHFAHMVKDPLLFDQAGKQ